MAAKKKNKKKKSRTDEGAKVAAGIYLIRAQRGGMRVLRRIALVP